MLSQSRLKEFVTYDPVTGIFVWLPRTGDDKGTRHFNQRYAGTIAGGKAKHYQLLKIDGVVYSAYRLAWLYMTGSFPAAMLDHKDGNKRNNAIDNLREATRSQNMANRPLRANNTTGARGVWQRKSGTWYALVKDPSTKKSRYLGTFQTKENAVAARRAEELRIYGEFAFKS
jgi:hypothetical protein